MTNWISVKDRLPEHEQEGIFYDGARVLTGWWLANENAVTDAEHYERSKGITHWMPLPAAPTAGYEAPAASEWRRECGDADRLLHALGLNPDECRTEGGSLNVPRIVTLLKGQP